jgi:hypothetical protein
VSQKRERKKKKRAERERKYARRKADEAAEIPAGYSTPVMKHFVFDNPLSGLSDEERRTLLQKAGEEAERSFSTSVDTLNSYILKHDPVQLLATVTFYTQFQGVGPKTDFTKSSHFPQALAETLQSLCLRHRAEQFGTAPVLHPDWGRVLNELTNCSKDFARKRYQALAKAEAHEKHLLLAIESARMHTQMMRNWGYPQHMVAIVTELFAPMDVQIQHVIGISATQLLQLMRGIHDTVCQRAMEFMRGFAAAFRQKGKRRVVSEFCKLAHVGGEEEAELQHFVASHAASKRGLKLLLISFFHQFLASVFTFTVEECLGLIPAGGDRHRVKRVLDSLSLPFGGLSDVPCEHVFMQSPIRAKPFIQIEGGAYFVPVVGLLHSHFVEMVESLILENFALKRAYHKRRSVYLETSITQAIRSAFPNCRVYSGTKWTDPGDGENYENDCFVVVGPVAVVFEAKSERINDSARRGARNTLKNQYKSLVQEPAMQATRFARLIESGQGVRSFATAAGGEYQLDLSPIRRAVSVSVTLDWFPATGMCWRQLLSAGLVTDQERPTLHVSLADLRVICEVLARPATLLHYFWRRSEWEENVDYLGDEEDLLVYYLSEGLGITGPLRDQSAAITLYGRSEELHRYYMADWAGEGAEVPRPKRILTKWWEAVLDRVDARTHSQKWDVACILLDFSYSRQESFEARFQETIAAVRRERGEHDSVIFSAGDSESHAAVVGFAYRRLGREERVARAVNLAVQARSKYGATQVVVVGRDVDRRDEPYSFLGYVDHSLGGLHDESFTDAADSPTAALRAGNESHPNCPTG